MEIVLSNLFSGQEETTETVISNMSCDYKDTASRSPLQCTAQRRSWQGSYRAYCVLSNFYATTRGLHLFKERHLYWMVTELLRKHSEDTWKCVRWPLSMKNLWQMNRHTKLVSHLLQNIKNLFNGHMCETLELVCVFIRLNTVVDSVDQEKRTHRVEFVWLSAHW